MGGWGYASIPDDWVILAVDVDKCPTVSFLLVGVAP